MADGFRNYLRAGLDRPGEQLLIDKAQLLTLTAPEMTVLVGGLRVLGVGEPIGTLTERVGSLTTDFFVNLLDVSTKWESTPSSEEFHAARVTTNNDSKWTASRADLVFGSNSRLRALAEVYASDDSQHKFVTDFVSAWAKVMDLDRFDLR
jgi:catalase-peroxidase